MRRSSRLTYDRTYAENNTQMGPKAKKSRSDNKISNIATLDNGTMVETLKYLNYMQLAKSSLVAKRFSNLICTHRHSLALLDVESTKIFLKIPAYFGGWPMLPFLAQKDRDSGHTDVKIFNKELSPEAYTEWVVRNSYSNKIIHKGRVAKMQWMQYGHQVYEMRAEYRDSNQSPNGTQTTVFSARKELNHKYWPLFQHFVRLLSDPFIYIRFLKLIPQIDVSFLNLLAGAVNPYQNRLQCGQLDIYLQGNVQKLLDLIKNHVHCNELRFSYQSGSNYDEALLDFFMTGAHCTSAINFKYCDISNVVVAFLQKFMDLKSGDESQMVVSIRCYDIGQVVKILKANYAEHIVKEETCGVYTALLFELINNDIGKQLQITTTTSIPNNMFKYSENLLKIRNL
ncbi:hypothetical protein Ddc_12691 [Ditylenchus destructor]|nr:hypothetical protein Ddc_12691 [Ditylenchus destructor]